jgi:hypothetical protein
MVTSAEKLASLEARAEKLRQQLAEKERALKEARREISRKEKIAARKERTRKLIQLGGLVEMVGLAEIDKGALVGGLKKIAKDLERREKSLFFTLYKKEGDLLLSEKESEKLGEPDK